jgi:hypothetical protein
MKDCARDFPLGELIIGAPHATERGFEFISDAFKCRLIEPAKLKGKTGLEYFIG